ncbi:hypothetical protein HYV70_03685 [Candidatus Uhrbacteria bacterium]|nr:hypothetical protein [Candidatus Uhrbacteria bacterium]
MQPNTYSDAYCVMKRFTRSFQEIYPLSHYIVTCGISKVSICDPSAPKDEQNLFCIKVGVHGEPPKGYTVPHIFDGVKLYVESVGRVHALLEVKENESKRNNPI